MRPRAAAGGSLFNQVDVFENLLKQHSTKHSVTHLMEPADIFALAHMDTIYTKYFPACEINCSLHDCVCACVCGGFMVLAEIFIDCAFDGACTWELSNVRTPSVYVFHSDLILSPFQCNQQRLAGKEVKYEARAF